MNLAGAEVIIRVNERIQELSEQAERVEGDLRRFRDLGLPAPPKEQ